MSWDEALFGWAFRKVRALSSRSGRSGHPEIALASMRDRLRTLAIAVGGQGVRVREAEAEGGIRGASILLPSSLDLFPDAEQTALVYVARTVLAATAIREGLSRLPRDAPALSPLERAILSLVVLEEARVIVEDELEASRALFRSLYPELLALRTRDDARSKGALEALVRGVLSLEGPIQRASDELPWGAARRIAAGLGRAPVTSPVPLIGWVDVAEGGEELDAGEVGRVPLPGGTERTLRPRDHVERKSLGKNKLNENPLIHTFEKLHTLEEHRGGMKRLDGEDELDEHAEAIEELDMREVVRSDEDARSLLRSDVMFETSVGDVGDSPDPEGIPYDEWHEAERGFRAGWCRVAVERTPPPRDRVKAERDVEARLRELRPRVEEVKRELLRVLEARRPRNRQLDGPDVDLDALVDRHASLLALSTPPDRLYVARRRHAPDLAVLVLVDLSLSTDGWVQGERVIDVERDAALVLGEALDGRMPEFGIAGFSSHTRRHCRFHVIKGMHEPWLESRARLLGLEPTGYTRIGPALRHATQALSRTQSSRRLILLLTDGKPNDFDRYEGRHGIADVRHAVLEAQARGVHVHALAIDREARFGLARMFLDHRYTLLASPSSLANAMGEVIASMQR